VPFRLILVCTSCSNRARRRTTVPKLDDEERAESRPASVEAKAPKPRGELENGLVAVVAKESVNGGGEVHVTKILGGRREGGAHQEVVRAGPVLGQHAKRRLPF
jgi:hypothetical protein